MSETVFRKLVALAPSAEAYSLLAMALANQSKLEEVPTCFGRALMAAMMKMVKLDIAILETAAKE